MSTIAKCHKEGYESSTWTCNDSSPSKQDVLNIIWNKDQYWCSLATILTTHLFTISVFDINLVFLKRLPRVACVQQKLVEFYIIWYVLREVRCH